MFKNKFFFIFKRYNYNDNKISSFKKLIFINFLEIKFIDYAFIILKTILKKISLFIVKNEFKEKIKIFIRHNIKIYFD